MESTNNIGISIPISSGNLYNDIWTGSGNYIDTGYINYTTFETINFYLFDKKYTISSETPNNDIEFISTLNILGWKYFIELKRNGYFNLSKRTISDNLVEFLLKNETKFNRKNKLEKINNI